MSSARSRRAARGTCVLYAIDMAKMPWEFIQLGGVMSDVSATDLQSPDPIPASEFALAAGVTTFVLLIGHKRIGFLPGREAPEVGTGWTTALALSPTSAKMLVDTLVKGITEYEGMYGAIPFDHNQKPKSSSPQKS